MRRKQISKRRWLRRYAIGQWLPHIALLQHPKLLKRISIEPAIYSVARDAYMVKDAYRRV